MDQRKGFDAFFKRLTERTDIATQAATETL